MESKESVKNEARWRVAAGQEFRKRCKVIYSPFRECRLSYYLFVKRGENGGKQVPVGPVHRINMGCR